MKKSGYDAYKVVRKTRTQQVSGVTSARKKSLLRLGYVDYPLVLIVFFLIIFGLIMLYSTSSYQGGLEYGDAAYYLKRQMAVSIGGLIIMLFMSYLPDYHFYKKVSVPVYLMAVAMVVLIIWFGYEGGGAKRWLYIGPVSVQPAEIAKVAIIILMASILTDIRELTESTDGSEGFNSRIATYFFHLFFLDKKTFFKYLTAPALLAILIYTITDNFSSAAIVMGIALIMLYVALPDSRKVVLFIIALFAAAALALYLILNYADPEDSVRFARIFAWNDLEAYASGKGYQTLQSLYAIGSGGIFGKGLGQSIQKTGFIPEAQNDMIFSIICEELGLFGGFSVIIMFAMLLWRLLIIASNARDLFGSLIVTGVMAHISIQVILNIAVVTNVIPNTGITLPFISYGGSATLVLLAEFGLVMNVARRI